MKSEELLQLSFRCRPSELLDQLQRRLVAENFRAPWMTDQLSLLFFGPFKYAFGNQSKGFDASSFLRSKPGSRYEGVVRGYSCRTAHILVFE